MSAAKRLYTRGALAWGGILAIGNTSVSVCVASTMDNVGVPTRLAYLATGVALGGVKSAVYGGLWPVTAPWLISKLALAEDDYERKLAFADMFSPVGLRS